MFGDKRVEKKKTPVYKCNLNPIFNATFEFDVPWEQARRAHDGYRLYSQRGRSFDRYCTTGSVIDIILSDVFFST